MNCRLRLFKTISSLTRPHNSRIIFARPLTSRRSIAEDFDQFERNSHEGGNFEKAPYDKRERPSRLSEQQLYLSEKLSKGAQFEKSDWDDILAETLAIKCYAAFAITPVNLTGNVINFCNQQKNFKLALSFMEYLEEKGEEINTGTISTFLKLCHYPDADFEEKVVLKYCDILLKRLTIMDATTAENLILALCLTSRWEESIKLLDVIKLSDTVSGRIFSTLAIAAFKHKKVEMGWSWLTESASSGKSINPDAFGAWFEYCAGNKPTAAGAERLLNFSTEQNLPFGAFTADDIKQYFEFVAKPPWKVLETTVKSFGKCMGCGKQLPPIYITEDEFKTLSAAFFEKVVLGRDIFTKSTPEEIDNFKSFLQQSQPYDVVIDGLNVAYSCGVNSVTSPVELLCGAVEYFLERDMKVMVIGRIHMLKWNKRKMDFIENNCKVFLAQNLSHDDPFLLYATMFGGLDTYFVSRDFMRGHKHRLGDVELGRLFKRWQLARQYSIFGSRMQRRVKISPPVTFLPYAQKTGESWHVPFDREKEDNSQSMFSIPENWLCISKK